MRQGREPRSSCRSPCAQRSCFRLTPGTSHPQGQGVSPRLHHPHQVRMRGWGWASAIGTPGDLGLAGGPFWKGLGAGEPAWAGGDCPLEKAILQEIPPVPAQLLRPTTSLLRPGSTGVGPLAVGCPFPILCFLPPPSPLSRRMASGHPHRSHAPGGAEGERAGVAAEDHQRSESPRQRELHSEDSGSASPVIRAEQDKSPSIPATSGYRQDPRGPPLASGHRAGQGEAAGLAGGSGAAGLGPFLPCCQQHPGGDGASAPWPRACCVQGSGRRAGERDPLFPPAPAPAYSSPRSCSSSGAAAADSSCQLEGEEKEAHDYFLAFLNSTKRVTAGFVSKALPAAPSWVLPCLLPVRRALGGLLAVQSFSPPGPLRHHCSPSSPCSCWPCLCPLTLPLCLSSP